MAFLSYYTFMVLLPFSFSKIVHPSNGSYYADFPGNSHSSKTSRSPSIDCISASSEGEGIYIGSSLPTKCPYGLKVPSRFCDSDFIMYIADHWAIGDYSPWLSESCSTIALTRKGDNPMYYTSEICLKTVVKMVVYNMFYLSKISIPSQLKGSLLMEEDTRLNGLSDHEVILPFSISPVFNSDSCPHMIELYLGLVVKLSSSHLISTRSGKNMDTCDYNIVDGAVRLNKTYLSHLMNKTMQETFRDTKLNESIRAEVYSFDYRSMVVPVILFRRTLVTCNTYYSGFVSKRHNEYSYGISSEECKEQLVLKRFSKLKDCISYKGEEITVAGFDSYEGVTKSMKYICMFSDNQYLLYKNKDEFETGSHSCKYSWLRHVSQSSKTCQLTLCSLFHNHLGKIIRSSCGDLVGVDVSKNFVALPGGLLYALWDGNHILLQPKIVLKYVGKVSILNHNSLIVHNGSGSNSMLLSYSSRVECSTFHLSGECHLLTSGDLIKVSLVEHTSRRKRRDKVDDLLASLAALSIKVDDDFEGIHVLISYLQLLISNDEIEVILAKERLSEELKRSNFSDSEAISRYWVKRIGGTLIYGRCYIVHHVRSYVRTTCSAKLPVVYLSPLNNMKKEGFLDPETYEIVPFSPVMSCELTPNIAIEGDTDVKFFTPDGTFLKSIRVNFVDKLHWGVKSYTSESYDNVALSAKENPNWGKRAQEQDMINERVQIFTSSSNFLSNEEFKRDMKDASENDTDTEALGSFFEGLGSIVTGAVSDVASLGEKVANSTGNLIDSVVSDNPVSKGMSAVIKGLIYGSIVIGILGLLYVLAVNRSSLKKLLCVIGGRVKNQHNGRGTTDRRILDVELGHRHTVSAQGRDAARARGHNTHNKHQERDYRK